MTREKIAEKLREILKYSVPNGEELVSKAEEDSNLYTDLGLTSVGMLYSVIAIEEVFQIRFDNTYFGDFNTVKDVVDYILSDIQIT